VSDTKQFQIDALQAAQLIIDWRGPDAAQEANARAHQLFAAHDFAGWLRWLQILHAIEVLQGEMQSKAG
jgi:hypothetical protein